MKNIFATLILSVTILCSCSQQNSTGTKTEADVPSSIVKSDTGDFKGLCTNDKFFICSSENVPIIVRDKTNKLDSVYRYLLPDFYNGQAVYLEVKGIRLHAEIDTLIINNIYTAEQKNYYNTCIPYDYFCKGNEPFWQIQISEKENLIDFYDPMIPMFYHFAFSKPEIKNSIITYNSENKSDKIEIVITSEKCNDGMSEVEYNFKSEVILNGKTFSGCAIKFGEGEKIRKSLDQQSGK